MRHAVRGRKLSRTSEHRKAMLRNLAQSLFEHGQVRTTRPKAHEVRPFAEKLISLAIDGSLAARQRATSLLNDRAIIRKDNRDDYDRMTDAKRAQVLRSRSGRRYRAATTRPGVPFTAESVINKLFTEIGPKLKARNEKNGCSGGYTRLIKLGERRLGDGGETAILQIVSADDKPRAGAGERTERKRRATTKYDFYAGKPLRKGRRRASAKAGSPKNAPTAVAVEEPTAEAPEQASDQGEKSES